MISDEAILINRLWDISLDDRNGKIIEMKQVEKIWKKEAYRFIMNYKKRIQKYEKS
jgi:hypothetical protein